jgi:hypothetical protein
MGEHTDKSKEHKALNLKQVTESVGAVKNARYTDPAKPRTKSANDLAHALTPLVRRLKACPICRAKVTRIMANNTKPEDRRLPPHNNCKRLNNTPQRYGKQKDQLAEGRGRREQTEPPHHPGGTRPKTGARRRTNNRKHPSSNTSDCDNKRIHRTIGQATESRHPCQLPLEHPEPTRTPRGRKR